MVDLTCLWKHTLISKLEHGAETERGALNCGNILEAAIVCLSQTVGLDLILKKNKVYV